MTKEANGYETYQVLKLAQYLTGLTIHQDVWIEIGKALVTFFSSDMVAFGERCDDDIVCHHWTFSDRVASRTLSEPATKDAIIEVLESGFLSTRLFSTPEPLSVLFLPITQENLVTAVMLVGYQMSEPFPKELLEVYLAVSGLVGTTISRLASEKELREHRVHLEELVKKRTSELTETNEKLHVEIVEKLALEQQLRQSQKLESLGVLAGGIAHDFNNILAIIIGYCELTKLHYEKAEVNIPIIAKAAERAAGLCSQMLAYAGKAQLAMTQINMCMLVEEMVNMLKSTLPQNAIIKSDLSADIPVVSGDSSQLRQIVMNLIVNASEAIGKEQGEIQVTLVKTTLIGGESDKDYNGKIIPSGDYVCLEVSDNGCGMDNETKYRIFEPFYTTKFTGRGLGMSALLGIIMSHGGALQLFSQLGQGTTFKVYLPVQKGDFAGDDDHLTSETSDPWLGSGTILLVEDEEHVRLIAKAMLNKFGLTVLEAVNGKEALELYQRNATDITLVMTDIGMPVMDGYELFSRLKNLNNKLPIIISSGFGDAEVSSRIPIDDIAGLISKPYKFDQLREVLKTVLEGTPSAHA
jgi:signal transduction histidine kinase